MRASSCLTAAATIVLATTAARTHLADPEESVNEALEFACSQDLPMSTVSWEYFIQETCPELADILADEFASRQEDEKMFAAWVGSKCWISRTYADTIKTPCFYNSIVNPPFEQIHHGLCMKDDDCNNDDYFDDAPPFKLICQKFIGLDGVYAHGLCFPEKPMKAATTSKESLELATTPEQSTKAVTTPEQPKEVTTPEQSMKAATTREKPLTVATTPEQSTKVVTTPGQPKAVTTLKQSTKAATTPEKPSMVAATLEQSTEIDTTPLQLTISLTTTENGVAGNSAGSLFIKVLSLAVYHLHG